MLWLARNERGVLGDRVHCCRGESNFLRATDPVTFAEYSPSNATELRSLALGDEFMMNKAADVEKHDEHGFC
jgi:hypothetical protein